MDPLTLLAGKTATNLLRNLLDRYSEAQKTRIDTTALIRLLIIEARRNGAVLNVAVGHKEPLSISALWDVPAVLQVDVLEALLSRDARSDKALKQIAALKPTVRADGDDDSSAVTLAMSLYVRTTTL